VVTSLSPSKGGPGQAVTVSGAHFMSADGQIVADFGGVAAATDCPVQTSCSVVVPTLAGAPRSVKLTITSEAGTSSGVAFSYR
jgi:IPT/TIG domain